MGTLVSPILGTAVAIPAASRCSERMASRVEVDRIGIVEETTSSGVDKQVMKKS